MYALVNKFQWIWLCSFKHRSLAKGERESGFDTNDGEAWLPRPQATPRFYLIAMEKNWEKAWNHCYVKERKWWIQLVRNVNSVCTNRVHHFQPMT